MNRIPAPLFLLVCFLACGPLLPRVGLFSRLEPPLMIKKLTFERFIGEQGTGPGQFSLPQGICTDLEGNLYVADTGNDRIQKFDAAGRLTAQTGGFGYDNEQFSKPTGVFIRNSIDLWVVDSRNERVQQFDILLHFLGSYRLTDFFNPETNFGRLYGLVVSAGGDIYISDQENEKIYQFNPYGDLNRVFGEFGTGEGHVQGPAALALDQEGKLYICDSAADRVVVFDGFGDFVTSFGQGELAAPMGVAVDRYGFCYVADTGNHRVAVFDRDGKQVFTLGAKGSGPAGFKEPHDVAVTDQDELLVSDTGNSRIQKFKIIRETQ